MSPGVAAEVRALEEATERLEDALNGDRARLAAQALELKRQRDVLASAVRALVESVAVFGRQVVVSNMGEFRSQLRRLEKALAEVSP